MITYCTNIHRGETWQEVFKNLRTHLPAVKEAVSPHERFPIGLRLSHLASTELAPEESARFMSWCEEHDMFVATINGFPYGPFHAASIKEQAYFPDWRHAERVTYTERLASLLDAWLPAGVTGSISTVPIGLKSHVRPDDYGAIRQNLTRALEHLDRLQDKSGKEIVLCLEPEPGCVLETTAEVISFFERMNFGRSTRNRLGVCFDCCHQAVEFEEPMEALSLLFGGSIRIGKVQVSSALRVERQHRDVLGRYDEPCYLHQVVIMNPNGSLTRYRDIPDALSARPGASRKEWRVHFHVPVFLEHTGTCGTTRSFTEEILSLLDDDVLLEVETYTWDVLPQESRTESVVQSIIREIEWVQGRRHAAHCRS